MLPAVAEMLPRRRFGDWRPGHDVHLTPLHASLGGRNDRLPALGSHSGAASVDALATFTLMPARYSGPLEFRSRPGPMPQQVP